MPAHVVVLRSGPGTPAAAWALNLAQTLRGSATPVTVVLIQDAVLAACSAGALPVHQQVHGLLDTGARCVFLAEDLALRGYGRDGALLGCEPTDYAGLVDLLLVDGAHVAGAF